MITPMEAEENGCRLSPSAYVSEEYDLEIQDEFVETMGEFIRLKQEWEGC